MIAPNRSRPAALAATAVALTALALLGAPTALGAGAPVAEPSAAAGQAGSCPVRSVTARAGVTRRIAIRCALSRRPRARAVNRARARVGKGPRGGRILALNQRANRVRYRARPGFSGRDRFVVVRRLNGRRWRLAVRIEVRGVATPLCEPARVTTNYETNVQVAITCTGDGLEPLAVAGGPQSGALAEVEEGGDDSTRTLTATYTPDPLFVGDDALVVGAGDSNGAAQGTVSIEVLPWRMRAIGDSVTAGFGYFGDGSKMQVSDLPECIPPAAVNNRCSSNSDEEGGYDGPPSWSADFGLANDVSWAAQFANAWQGGGSITAPVMFQNRAVTGSAPGDWLPGGALNGELEAIVAENPDLIPMTMGANPLLSDILESEDGEECADSDDVAALIDCVQPYFADADLLVRLEALYTALLEAPDAQIVAFQYHLAVPSATLFTTWQLEALSAYLNAQISTAVESTRQALPPAEASRLTVIEAQTDPADTDPHRVPRFNLGLPPEPPHDGWSATYDCGSLFTDLVDGPSHQSEPTQDELELEHPLSFCEGPEWIIGADTGIHPNAAGYAQLAATLATVAAGEGLVPVLP